MIESILTNVYFQSSAGFFALIIAVYYGLLNKASEKINMCKKIELDKLVKQKISFEEFPEWHAKIHFVEKSFSLLENKKFGSFYCGLAISGVLLLGLLKEITPLVETVIFGFLIVLVPLFLLNFLGILHWCLKN